MRTELSTPSPARRKVRVEIPPDEVDKIFDRVLRDARRSMNVPGFRKGKAPLSLVRQRVGPSLGAKVAESLVDTFGGRAIDSEGVAPIEGSIQMELDEGAEELPPATEGQSYSFTLTADVVPELDLEAASYKGVTISRSEAQVEPQDVEDEMSRIRESLAKLVPVTDRASADGDLVEVDIEGSELGGDPLVPKKTQVVLLGQEGNLPEFDKGLAGLRPGDDFAFEVAFPEEFPEESLRAKHVYFKGEVRTVMQRVVPELDDEAASKLGDDIGSLAELREKVREALAAAKEREAERVTRHRLLDRLLDLFPFEAPPSLVERELRERLDRLGRRLAAQGIDPEKMQVDWNKVLEEQRGEADKTVREALLLDAIAKRESLAVESAEVDAAVSDIARDAGEKPSVVRSKLVRSGALESLRAQLLRGKCLDWLMSEANIV